MSLGEGWTIRKTQLQNKFSRRNVDAAWKELAIKQYAVGFSAYVDGKKDYFYAVSDIPISQANFELLVIEQINLLQSQGKNVMTLSVMQHSPLEITEKMSDVQNVHQTQNKQISSDVRSVQHSVYNTERTPINKKETNEKLINKKISSSPLDFIDDKLREKYNNVPFDEVKNEMLNDTVVVDTDKQYKSLLEYRLKHWKPKQTKRKRVVRNVREEMVPKWLQTNDENAIAKDLSVNNDFEAEKEKIKEELMQLEAELKAGNR
ncbi:replication protein [Listeria monocytogenes]|nr:replication protein [Listeria monocytogenes]QSF36518.1 replication protein [Priestia megaterium]QSF42419.1 replication protein [Priestia megaterium]